MNLDKLQQFIDEANREPKMPFLIFINNEDYKLIYNLEGVSKEFVAGTNCLKYNKTFIYSSVHVERGHYKPLYGMDFTSINYKSSLSDNLQKEIDAYVKLEVSGMTYYMKTYPQFDGKPYNPFKNEQ